MRDVQTLAAAFKAACDALGVAPTKDDVFKLLEMAGASPVPARAAPPAPAPVPTPSPDAQPASSASRAVTKDATGSATESAPDSATESATESATDACERAEAPRPRAAAPQQTVTPPWLLDDNACAPKAYTTTYVLALRDGRYYVGFTRRLPERLKEHYEGRGAAWTKHFPVERLVGVKYGTQVDETAETLKLMARHGIDRVRGGAYSQPALTPDETRHLQRLVWSCADMCQECGSDSHYSSACPASGKRARTDAPLACLPRVDHELFTTRRAQMALPGLTCGRCGWGNHISALCFAKAHRNRSALPPLDPDEGEGERP